MEKYIYVNGKNLRCGYTTGTCACAAAMFATNTLLSIKGACVNNTLENDNSEKNSLENENIKPSVVVDTPAGIPVELDIYNVEASNNYVKCSVIKDGGDDPDVTSGIHIFAKAETVSDSREGVIIEGGEGIGIVTKPGLDQPVGNAAINSTPRKYITEIVEAVKKQYDCKETIRITISAPEGVEIARKTFNPRMGIEGGISIIGTTGIVEPMSNSAIVETTKLEINQRKEKGESVLYIAPGRIGEGFANNIFGIDSDDLVLCSNNVFEAIENAVLAGFKEIVYIGHIGKLVKLGYGAKNTHSANNDGRIEELTLCALNAGADIDCLRELADCVTTDGAISVLDKSKILDKTMGILGDRIENTLSRWVEGKAHIKLCVFTNFNNEPRILIDRGF